MIDITKTTISISEVNTPKLNANEININNFGTLNSDSLNSETAYIKNLLVDTLSINDGEINGNTIGNETYETAIFDDVTLKFDDSYNGKYLFVDHTALFSDETTKVLYVNFDVPSNLGSRLTCRYLIVDLRNAALGDSITTVYPDDSETTWKLKWLYGAPGLEPGYFYVIAFQRLSKDLIVGNTAVKIEM